MGLVITVSATFNIHKVVLLLGATETIAPYAKAYAQYIFIAAPFMICSFIMNNLLRFQGKASYAMVGITIGGLLNIALDPLFIFTLGMGTAGAALATGLSQFISFFYGCAIIRKAVFLSAYANSARNWLFTVRSFTAASHLWDVRELPAWQPSF